LAAWLLYTMNRRRKAERYALAMDRYRERLLTLGVAQWIKVGQVKQVVSLLLYLPWPASWALYGPFPGLISFDVVIIDNHSN